MGSRHGSMKDHKFNMVDLSKLAKPPLYVTAIILNIVALAFVFRGLANKIRKAEILQPFKWGEQAPELPTTFSISEDTLIVLKGKNPLTVMAFFDSSHMEQIHQIDVIRNRYGQDKNLQMFGVFRGNQAEGRELMKNYDIHMPIVADPNSEIFRRFRLHAKHKSGGTMVLDDSLKVRLYFRSIVSDTLLEQFIIRKLQAIERNADSKTLPDMQH
jgi:peroxiredoxin